MTVSMPMASFLSLTIGIIAIAIIELVRKRRWRKDETKHR